MSGQALNALSAVDRLLAPAEGEQPAEMNSDGAVEHTAPSEESGSLSVGVSAEPGGSARVVGGDEWGPSQLKEATNGVGDLPLSLEDISAIPLTVPAARLEGRGSAVRAGKVMPYSRGRVL
jgi:hypothetical protein